jgi:subtilisin-like proprotein convertase family protein
VSTTPRLADLIGEPVQGDWRLTVADLARVDQGKLQRWGLELVLEPTPPIRAEVTPALAIPDKNPAGITSTLEIGATGIAREIKVSVDITHTFIGDLTVDLITPSGTRVPLHKRLGGGKDNLVATFDNSTLPELAGLEGEPVHGTWRLHVADLAGQDVGKLNRWGIELRTD